MIIFFENGSLFQGTTSNIREFALQYSYDLHLDNAYIVKVDN